MTDSVLKDIYSIQIGSEDIIAKQISSILSETNDSSDFINDYQNEKRLLEILKEIRVRIWTLLKTDNVSFLVGAGASISAGGVSLATIPNELEEKLVLLAKKEVQDRRLPSWITLFYKTVSALCDRQFAYKERTLFFRDIDTQDIEAIPVNLEDYLSHLYMWLSGIGENGESVTLKKLDGNKLIINKATLETLIRKINCCLTAILDLPVEGKEHTLNIHRKFLKKILTRPLNLRRVNLFTLNYDTLIEKGADAEGAVLVDGFVGTLQRVFRPESYDLDFYFPAQTTEGRVHRFDRAMHLYKLHGSITWYKTLPGWENPYGLYATFFKQDNKEDEVIIYPSPLKYGQALDLPYSELFRRFGNSVAQPQAVLFTIGYGFGDEHVNAIIRQALAIPSFTLVVVDPEPNNDFVVELMNLGDDRVWIVRGWELGTFEHFVNKLLPDLREEEIEAKVMKTFQTLTFKNNVIQKEEECSCDE